jgi:hypothetical protein
MHKKQTYRIRKKKMSYKDQRKQKDQAVALDALTAEKKALYLYQANTYENIQLTYSYYYYYYVRWQMELNQSFQEHESRDLPLSYATTQVSGIPSNTVTN